MVVYLSLCTSTECLQILIAPSTSIAPDDPEQLTVHMPWCSSHQSRNSVDVGSKCHLTWQSLHNLLRTSMSRTCPVSHATTTTHHREMMASFLPGRITCHSQDFIRNSIFPQVSSNSRQVWLLILFRCLPYLLSV